ncbi:SLC13 family permease [Marinimicrobium sp. ABcell2]|uniref:SLC13 family permease n=1 Tax=Marinimicrobium sp. ABcell2 TaxID=3069751 RepID=UPI0027B0F0B7|nr:SLC13 family permease [Marinimicrobium sp. ABcell2]MDQ2075855.1 SLC13 family permease [Marinimicrobium sp. ABcell2]
MTHDQITILAILAATLGMFLWGRWRHDMVALAALLACVVAGLIPDEQAFEGFGHGAVITVASVLVISRGLQMTGAIDVMAQRLIPQNSGLGLSIVALTGLGAALSAFMNNVGALALLMPIAIQLSGKQGVPAGRLLMPLAFGTILGGMTTLIGTPPNLIVSGFRAEQGAGAFNMFDFTPVGGLVALVGVVFIALLGWRLVPKRVAASVESFETATYVTEVRVTEKNKVVGKTLGEVEQLLDEGDAQIIGMVRHEMRVLAPRSGRLVQAGDILVLEAEPESLSSVLSSLGLSLEEAVEGPQDNATERAQQTERDNSEDRKDSTDGNKEDTERSSLEDSDIAIQELVTKTDSTLIGRSASDINLRARYGVNLLALSRQGRRSVKRLRTTPIEAGDVLLMQGPADSLGAFAREYGCIPLAARSVDIPNKSKAIIAVGILMAAVLLATLGWLTAAVAFAGAMLAYMALRIIPLRSVYESVDWPVIVLLAAMMPVAGVMANTGAADLVAVWLLELFSFGGAVMALVIIMVVTIVLSSFMNNAATAAVMCQIAISSADQLQVNADTFLMAVAIGASCAFLTPIAHQNNTLILGPGGFRFGDYWRLGLPMEIIVVALGTPLLLWIWPLH